MLAKSLDKYWQSFSFIGLVFAALFFSASVTPSLLPRPYFVQGLLSGFAIAIGYGLGVSLLLLYQFLEFRNPSERIQTLSKRVTSVTVAVLFIVSLWKMAYWQNSIRELMNLPVLETAYPYRMAFLALVTGTVLIAFMRLMILSCRWLSEWLNRLMPRRVSIVISFFVVALTFIFVSNDIIARALLDAADRFFLHADELIDDGVERPQGALMAGSEQSLIEWESIGRQGKNFITGGPTQSQIRDFVGREAMQPIRVYVGMRTLESPRERAELALEELKRVGGFERSLLVVATPTGTGWLDPGAVDTIEYLHAGDTAIVSTQYSYLPSWITILVDPRRSIESADQLFEVVYAYWKTLPKDKRPMLYLQGLSLGSLGSERSADLYTTFEDPIQGALWSGPPFPSIQWNEIVSHRNEGTPAWLPTYRDERLVRFTSQKNAINAEKPWGPIRNVYIQYASDPMVFFSPSLLYQRPSWLSGDRGPDVSPHLTWYPIVTFLQVAFDLPLATSIPIGFGHNYAPASYVDGWYAVTQPEGWSDSELVRLKEHFEANDRAEN
jgi:uncharacterized membrane protein